MASKKKVFKTNDSKNLSQLENIVSNLDDLSDIDEEFDPLFGDNNLSSPSDSYLNLPEDQLIEKKLEEMFGLDLDSEMTVQDEEVITNDALIDVLSTQSKTTQSDQKLIPAVSHEDQRKTLQYLVPDGPHIFDSVSSSNLLPLTSREIGHSCPSPIDNNVTVPPSPRILTSPTPCSSASEQIDPLRSTDQPSCVTEQSCPSPTDNITVSPTPRTLTSPTMCSSITEQNNLSRGEEIIAALDEIRYGEGDVNINRCPAIPPRDRSLPRDWKIARTTHPIPLFERKAVPRSKYTHKSQPIDVFNDFFPDYVIEIIVEQTNRYAHQKNSRNWSPVTSQDIKAYLGVLIMMGLNPLPDMELYWSSDPFYNNAEISRTFTLTRFKKITENLHLNDNQLEPPKDSPHYDKLYKLRPVITAINNQFKSQMTNSSKQSVDECMVKFKGRSSLKQYMPKKPIKRGFKVWARCDAVSGYMYYFEIYTGKGDSVECEGLGYNVVMKLCNGLPNNTLVAFDNFFTSCNLMEDLYNKGIYAVGTVRSDRKDLPPIMKRTQPKNLKLQKHQFASMTCEPITAIKWLDTRDVTVLTTAHPPLATTNVKRTQRDGSREDILCPAAIASYTLTMGGVDHFDHFRSSYPIDRKSRKYWMRLFIFIFDSAIINAYITYNTTHVVSNHSHRNFRLKLARGLIENYSQKIYRPRVYVNKKGGCFGVPDEIRLFNVGVHLPDEGETYKRCRFCSTKKIQKRSKLICSMCNVTLCATPCFKLFHTAVNQDSEE